MQQSVSPAPETAANRAQDKGNGEREGYYDAHRAGTQNQISAPRPVASDTASQRRTAAIFIYLRQNIQRIRPRSRITASHAVSPPARNNSLRIPHPTFHIADKERPRAAVCCRVADYQTARYLQLPPVQLPRRVASARRDGR